MKNTYFLLFLFTFLSLGSIFSQEKNQITYIANEGVLIEYHGKKVIIDALHKRYLKIYQPTKYVYKESMVKGKTPFEDIDLMLVTHVHGDHFDTDFTIEFLENNLETILVAPQQVLDTMGAMSHMAVQFYPVKGTDKGLMYEMDGLSIHTLPLIHSYQKKNYWVQNMAYLLDFEGLKILHVGDAELEDDNFDRIQQAIGKGVDYALLPDWFFEEEAIIKQVKAKIKAKKYLAIHVMNNKSGTYESRLKKRVKPFNLDLNVFFRIGETETIVE